jgi:hypothetical protein
MMSIPLPQRKMDAFFPRVGELLERREFILKVRRTGVWVNVFLPFGSTTLDMAEEREKGMQENLWALKDFLEEGVQIFWDPSWDSNRSAMLVIDDKLAVQLEGGNHSTLQECPKFSHANYFNIIRGKVQVVQKLHRKPPDFDFFFRVAGYPIFLSSDRLTCGYNVGDEVEVAYLLNVSGQGTRTPFAPAAIFCEGLGMRLVEKAKVTASSEPKDLHRVVESLMQDLLPRYSDIITEERMEKWILNTRRAILKRLSEEKLFLDAGDDSFIYVTVESVAKRMRERFEHSYLERGLRGQLGLKFLRCKTKLRDRLGGLIK